MENEEFAVAAEVEPYAQYNVTVFAQTGGGIGDAVSVSFITPDGRELLLYVLCTYIQGHLITTACGNNFVGNLVNMYSTD